MEKLSKPANVYAKRNRPLTAACAALFLALCGGWEWLFAAAILRVPPESTE